MRETNDRPEKLSERRETQFAFLLVEIIDHYTDEQIQGEERAENDEENEIDENVNIVFAFWLNIDLSEKEKIVKMNRISTHVFRIRGISHNLDPTFERRLNRSIGDLLEAARKQSCTYHLEQGQVSV